MNAPWMFYMLLVGALFALAAFAGEQALRAARRPARLVWVVALVGALTWPIVLYAMGQASVNNRAIVATLAPTAPRASSSAMPSAGFHAAPSLWLPVIVPRRWRIDGVVGTIVMASPLVMLALLLLDLIRVRRARRRWPAAVVDRTPVLLSEDFGPAIIGLRTPQIVVPAWVLLLPIAQQRLLIAHEQEHVAKRDGALLLLGAMVLVFAPWNLAAWWSFRRLRLAIELDCDQRVLQRGHDVAMYGELLLTIGRRAGRGALLATAFAERRTMLRTRITAITALPAGRWPQLSFASIAGTLVLAGCAVRPTPASSPQSSGLRTLSVSQQPAALVGDSIAVAANDSSTNRYSMVKAADGLPAHFSVETPSSNHDPRTPSCATVLRDSSTGVTLRMRSSEARWSTDAANTASAVGYYYVAPSGSFGVPASGLLRVGCSAPVAAAATAARHSAVPARSAAMRTALRNSFDITADSMSWSATRFEVVYFADSTAWPEARIRSLANKISRSATTVDTIAITMMQRPAAPGTNTTSTRFFYPKTMPETLR